MRIHEAGVTWEMLDLGRDGKHVNVRFPANQTSLIRGYLYKKDNKCTWISDLLEGFEQLWMPDALELKTD